MAKRLSDEELRQLYSLDGDHTWFEVGGDHDREHPGYRGYLRQKRRLVGLLKHLDLAPADSVVDYGCGNGLLSELVAPAVARYEGVDFSPEYIELAKARVATRRISNATFYCGDIVEFSRQRPAAFDKALTIDFSEHIYDEQFLSIYSAIRTTLRKDGVLVVHTPNASFFLEQLKSKGVLRQTLGHVAVRSATEYRRLLESVGFRRIQIGYLPHYHRLLGPLHKLSRLPTAGPLFEARLLIHCVR